MCVCVFVSVLLSQFPPAKQELKVVHVVQLCRGWAGDMTDLCSITLCCFSSLPSLTERWTEEVKFYRHRVRELIRAGERCTVCSPGLVFLCESSLDSAFSGSLIPKEAQLNS